MMVDAVVEGAASSPVRKMGAGGWNVSGTTLVESRSLQQAKTQHRHRTTNDRPDTKFRISTHKPQPSTANTNPQSQRIAEHESRESQHARARQPSTGNHPLHARWHAVAAGAGPGACCVRHICRASRRAWHRLCCGAAAAAGTW
jgi:hypothetical protein